MLARRSTSSTIAVALCGGLGAGCASGLAPIDEGEWLPGGAGTNTVLLGGNAFLTPARTLEAATEQTFHGGNALFNQAWVEAPASTASRDGLGPLFNARSCSGCHFRDGRAAPPDEGLGPFVGLLLRVGLVDGDHVAPDPVYGGQLQDQALPGVPVEGLPRLTVDLVDDAFDDGTAYTLAAPTYTVEGLAHGALHADARLSPRIAPQMVGLGLLEAIPDAAIEAIADPDDADGDGISGRVQRRLDPETDALAIGRFGWKGDAPTVLAQVAGAFAGDLGITSSLHPFDDCSADQAACREATSGGDPEIDDVLLGKVAVYSASLAVPVRRGWEDPEVRRGKAVFHALGCATCHVPRHETGMARVAELSHEVIWPYTDLLLHDMGPGLADGVPVGEASGREWKTPPLWGLGRVPDVNGHARYLHDGRARGLEEAVLWHGGEAEPAADAYRALDAGDRAALVAFLEDL